MISRYEYPGGVWVDLERPSEDEVRDILHEFSISERIGMELLSSTPTPLVASDTGTALLVLHFPTPRADDGEMKSQEIDFIVGHHFIVTVRYELVISIHHLKKLLETEMVVEGGSSVSTDVLLEILFTHLYGSVRDHINHTASQLSRVEQEMFNGREHHTVRAISDLNRDFLHLEATLVNHEEPLVRFLRMLNERNFFGPSFTERVARVAAERIHVSHLVHTYRAVATELRETNKVLVETHQNEIMKTLTTVNIIFLPAGLLAWIFAMRTEGMPIIDSPNAFWIVIGMMFGVAAILIMFFIKKRWIF